MQHIQELIIAFGYIGIFVAVFAESGFLFGFFLPGDSLLFTLGLIASFSTGTFNIYILLILSIVAAIAGDNFGYWCGAKFGRKLFLREDSFFFRKSHIERTQKFYEKYGKKTIVLARFVPIVRTFAPIVAGIADMNYKTFFSYNIFGGILWPCLTLLSGYFLGSLFPGITEYLHFVIIGIIALSFLPVVFEYFKARREVSNS